MSKEEQMQLLESRNYKVVKDNQLIQKSRYKLTLQEQKSIAYICSLIKPVNPIEAINGEDVYKLNYEINVRDYCKVCGVDYDSGTNYKAVKDTLQQLADRSMWLENGDKITLVRWLSYVEISKKSGIIDIELDRTIAPYLFNLSQKFTQYQLFNILGMKSAFSVRIYELMKSYAFQTCKTFNLDELKKMLMVENVKSYTNFKDFRKYVLEKAQEEINELTDINIYFEPIKKGRKVDSVKFRIKPKNQDKAVETAIKVNANLNKGRNRNGQGRTLKVNEKHDA